MMLGALVVVVTVALLVRAGTAACAEAVVRTGSYSTFCKENAIVEYNIKDGQDSNEFI